MPFVETNGVATYYERRGTGPPIVFVHGAIVDHSQWWPQVTALSDQFTTYAYDVRGHGRTRGSDVDSYSVELFAADLDAFISALDVEQPILCGLSMGGCIAQVYAANHPDRLAVLVLADTFTPEIFDRWEWVQRSLLLRAVIPPVRLLGYERVEQAMVWLQERISKGVSGDYEKIQTLPASGPKMETDEFAKVVRALARFDETRFDLSAITVPTLVLYGEHEAGFVKRHASKLGREVPDAVVDVVPSGGHASNLDNPTFVTQALRDFCYRIGAGESSPEPSVVDDDE
ncbi:alpha/beta hydrolase [Haloarculaceae archaeon H-GB2-1]|nr:alpha/beta hydrolase [Haloarculaceae archaeon H-GB1-1]MEA5409859.1 alpha/beta hydrolase [Haloarculaceae archaeon H-GB2-1]